MTNTTYTTTSEGPVHSRKVYKSIYSFGLISPLQKSRINLTFGSNHYNFNKESESPGLTEYPKLPAIVKMKKLHKRDEDKSEPSLLTEVKTQSIRPRPERDKEKKQMDTNVDKNFFKPTALPQISHQPSAINSSLTSESPPSIFAPRKVVFTDSCPDIRPIYTRKNSSILFQKRIERIRQELLQSSENSKSPKPILKKRFTKSHSLSSSFDGGDRLPPIYENHANTGNVRLAVGCSEEFRAAFKDSAGDSE